MFGRFIRSSSVFSSSPLFTSLSSRLQSLRCRVFDSFSLRLPGTRVLDSVVSRYLSALERYPIRVKMVQSLVIATIGDVVAQKLTAQSDTSPPSKTADADETAAPPTAAGSIDWRRTASLATYAFLWTGPFSHAWFNAAEKLVPSKSWGGVMKKVFLDQFVLGPPCTVLFFVAVGALEGHSRAKIQDNMQNNLVRTQIACWSVWPAINMVTFSVIPVPLRPLFSGLVSVLWSGFVSWSLHHTHTEELVPRDMSLPQSL
jgi:hypothetical protein